MSYLYNNPKFSRIIEAGLSGIEEKSFPASNPSNRVVDYMHLPEFKELLEHTKSIQQITKANPIPIMGFTKEKQASLLKALLAGADLKDALDISCIRKKHFEYWVRLADKNIQPFQDFIEQVVMAQGLFRLELVQLTLEMGGKGAVELLKLRHAEVVEANRQNAPALSQQVTVNIMDRKPDERKDMVNSFLADIDPSQIINYPLKELDTKD